MRTLLYSLIFLLATLVCLPTTPVFAQLPTTTPTPKADKIFMPVISGGSAQLSPGVQGGSIYGLVGRISKATGQTFGNYLIATNNVTYGIVGINAVAEERIIDLRDRQPPVLVKIWGDIYSSANNISVIVISDLLAGDPVPTATPVAKPTVRVKFDLVNLYAGPNSTYAVTGRATINQICDLIGRSSTNNWWEIRCPNNLSGWIASQLVEIRGDANSAPLASPVAVEPPVTAPTPTSTPLPQATPTPGISDTWRATYFNNQTLDGAPVGGDDIAVLYFNWGANNRPDPGLTASTFSARFERTIYFNPGYYRFILTADDGARVWLDNQLLFDEWHGASGQIYSLVRSLSGNHTMRVEYYDTGGVASLRFTYTLITEAPVWVANYFNGINPAGTPLFTQQEPRIATGLDYNWGAASPDLSLVPASNWSARWVGSFRFEAGNYIFRANADDGVRVYLNDQLVIDNWNIGYHEDSKRFVGIGADTHTIRVEYYEQSGSARVRVWWYRETGGQPIPQ